MITIKKPVSIKEKRYEAGKEFKPKKSDIPLVIQLNEKGFIEPLNREELLKFINSFNLPEKGKKTKNIKEEK